MKEKNKKVNLSKEGKAGNANKKEKNSNQRQIILFMLAGLIILTVLVFSPMLSNQFTSWDDGDYITKNSKITALNSTNLKAIFTEPIAYNYHPFTMLSLAINYSFSKLNPYSYFLTNLILHCLNIVLVFYYVFLLSKKNIHVALFTAIVFAIHPMHVESVAWATERKDVLYTFFFVLGLICHHLYLDNNKQKYLWLTFIFGVFSMFSKPAAIIFPLVLIATEYYRFGKFELKSLLQKIPIILVAGFFMYMTLVAQTQQNAGVGDFKTHGIPERFAFACYGFMVYLFKFFVPYHLATFHPYPTPITLIIYLSPLLYIGLITGIYFYKKQRNLLTFGFLFYLINLVLVLQFFSVGSAIYAERYTYVPYISIAFMLGMLLFASDLKIKKQIIWGVLSVGLVVFSVVAHARVKVWHNDETLWTDMIEKYPNKDRGYYDRGNYYAEIKNDEKAIIDFTNAIKVGTDDRTYTNRALAYTRLNRYEEALIDLNNSLKLKPNQAEGLVGRSRAYIYFKKFDSALIDANRAIETFPGFQTYYLRADIYKATGKYQEAINDYTKAASFGNDFPVYNNRGNTYFLMQDYEKAIADYNLLLKRNPNDANAITNRGAAYFQQGKYNEAIVDFNRAIALGFNAGSAYRNLALAYEKLGNKAKALEYANKAISMGVSMDSTFLNSLR